MLYLRTGSNGSGKTILTLRDVREKSLKENRPVYYNGRFELVADFGWHKIDIKDWETVPDGAIFIVDECHNDFPIRPAGSAVPQYVKMLAEHRRRGFDFYLITQHPLNIDSFVRRLIGAPGWHQHLKRVSGARLVSVIEWPSVNDNCQKPGSSDSGSVTMVSFPSEVFNWYVSTSLDTAKVKIPFMAWVLLASVLAVPVVGYLGWSMFTKSQGGVVPAAVASSPVPAVAASGVGPSAAAFAPAPAGPSGLTAAQLSASYVPRFDGLPYSAPRYDKLTEPTAAPFPAACLMMGKRCECYTQQATPMQIGRDLCVRIARNGFFKDWGDQGHSGASGRPAAASSAPMRLAGGTFRDAPPMPSELGKSPAPALVADASVFAPDAPMRPIYVPGVAR